MTTPTPSKDAEVVGRAARAAAHSLAAEHGPRLEADVELALHTVAGRQSAPEQYFDPISLGALIVSAATLAWTIYKDLKKQTPTPAANVVTRRVRLELPAGEQISTSERDRIIELVVENITTTPDV
jgi:hypothetical protein